MEDTEIRRQFINQVVKEVDEKVYQWMSTKQTKFKKCEKKQIDNFTGELIAYLNSLRTNTIENPKSFKDKIVTLHLGNKIIHIMETINRYIYSK